MNKSVAAPQKESNKKGFYLGIGLTLVIALVARYLAMLPFLSIMGQLVLAILLGMLYRAFVPVPEIAAGGISFSSKKLLRYGIILLGVRLNLADVIEAGPKVLAIAIINIIFAITVIFLLAKWFKVDQKLGLLTACGTAICGAAAVVAISPQLKASDEDTAISAATVAILGTIFTLCYTVLYPVLGLSASGYGIFSGATLHEIAHVIAAADPGGQSAVDLAVIVKLSRVAMLVPIAIIIGMWSARKERNENGINTKMSFRNIPIPWFIVGFLVMSGVNTLNIIPPAMVSILITISYLLIGMAMAGLGLGVQFSTFRKKGLPSFIAGGIGSILLSILGFALVHLFGLA
ncbi:YeiH family protein [Paenibacillus sp. Marseille-Q4541]|uniref:YeiH family protein n=1 Tax=Paenibacillus sp. Marseille-Q4541 TaxID=2831522 RepID=UPI001BACA08B|nr:YeiH family protein [Paenibacillus sp. Marseille-Q4541]